MKERLSTVSQAPGRIVCRRSSHVQAPPRVACRARLGAPLSGYPRPALPLRGAPRTGREARRRKLDQPGHPYLARPVLSSIVTTPRRIRASHIVRSRRRSCTAGDGRTSPEPVPNSIPPRRNPRGTRRFGYLKRFLGVPRILLVLGVPPYQEGARQSRQQKTPLHAGLRLPRALRVVAHLHCSPRFASMCDLGATWIPAADS